LPFSRFKLEPFSPKDTAAYRKFKRKRQFIPALLICILQFVLVGAFGRTVKEYHDKLIIDAWILNSVALLGIASCSQFKESPSFVVELFQPAFVFINLLCAMTLLIKNKMNSQEI